MKQFFRYFKVSFIIVGILLVIYLIVLIGSGSKEEYSRTNKETDLKSNVFDYADNLSSEQEQKLEAYIISIEDMIGCDIAVITLNETLSDRGYKSSPEHWVMEYADDFADEHKMGYDKAYGDSIVFVDNIYREEATGRVYSWISTSGRAMDCISQSDSESILSRALEDLTDYSEQSDYYLAYYDVVDRLPGYFGSGAKQIGNGIKTIYIFIASLVIAAFYVLINWSSKKGEVTTTSTTYVENGKPNVTRVMDVFIRKSVTKHKIETSSGSGGSGGHISSGGHSHGGGGHSR